MFWRRYLVPSFLLPCQARGWPRGDGGKKQRDCRIAEAERGPTARRGKLVSSVCGGWMMDWLGCTAQGTRPFGTLPCKWGRKASACVPALRDIEDERDGNPDGEAAGGAMHVSLMVVGPSTTARTRSLALPSTSLPRLVDHVSRTGRRRGPVTPRPQISNRST